MKKKAIEQKASIATIIACIQPFVSSRFIHSPRLHSCSCVAGPKASVRVEQQKVHVAFVHFHCIDRVRNIQRAGQPICSVSTVGNIGSALASLLSAFQIIRREARSENSSHPAQRVRSTREIAQKRMYGKKPSDDSCSFTVQDLRTRNKRL